MTTAADNLPVHLVDADLERMMLGAVLMDPSAFKRIRPLIATGDFALKKHQVIWNAMTRLAESGEPIDYVTLYNQLQQARTLAEAGGLTAIVVLDDGLPKILHLESYARAVRTKSLERRIWDAYGEISNQAALGIEKPGELLRQAREVADEIRDLDVGRAPVPYLLGDLERDLLNTADGLETGYEKLDRFLRIPQGAMTVIAGRPGHGKTTMLLNLLINFLRRYPERRFYLFSYEEARRWLALKIIMIMGGEILDRDHNLRLHLAYIKERSSNQVVKNTSIEAAVELYSELTSSGRLTIVDRRLCAEDLSIQKVPTRAPAQTRYQEIKHVSELLLDQSVLTGIPIIVGAQLGRSSGNKGREKVRLDNLRECGDIENDAALVIGLYNESADGSEEEGQPDNQTEVEIEVIVLKARAGAQGKHAKLTFSRPAFKVSDPWQSAAAAAALSYERGLTPKSRTEGNA